MNTLDDLRSVLDDRANAAAARSRPDLDDVRGRAQRHRRSRQRFGAAAAVTVLIAGVGVLLGTWVPRERAVTTPGDLTPDLVTIDVPLETTRTLGDGAVLTLTATAPRPTYGPYGSDHLTYPAPDCPADVRVGIVKGKIGEGGGVGAVVPVVVDRKDRVASDYSGGRGDGFILVPGSEAGRTYQLVDQDGAVVDETTADAAVTALVAHRDAPNAEPPPLAEAEVIGFDGEVVELSAQGQRLAVLPVERPDIVALTPESCWPSNQPVDLGSDSPPQDTAAAETAVGAAVSSIGAGMGQYLSETPIEPIEVRWESPTVAWVKYRIAYFPDDDGDGAGTGPVLWADVTSTGSTWTPSAAARCVYERSWGRGSTCTEAPDTQPVE